MDPPGWSPEWSTNWNTFYSDAPSDAKRHGRTARCPASTSTRRPSPTSSRWSIRTAPRSAPATCSARANQYVHLLRSLGLEKGDSVAAVLPNGVKPVEVYLAALQAGWYYVPINYRLSAPEIAYIIQDSGAKAIVSHERYAEVIAAAADEAGVPAEARLAHGTVPGFRDVEAALAEQPDHAPRRPRRRRGHALHVGHHRQAQGREAQALRLRPRRDGRAVHRLLQPLRHPAPRGPRAPLHLAELPHRRHDLRRQRAQLRATASCSWTSGIPRRRSPRSSSTRSPTPTWSPRSSTGCCSCPTT